MTDHKYICPLSGKECVQKNPQKTNVFDGTPFEEVCVLSDGGGMCFVKEALEAIAERL